MFSLKENKKNQIVMRNAPIFFFFFFWTDWMEEFDLFNIPLNTLCNKIDGNTTSSDKLKKRTKNNISGNIFRKTRILF